MLAACERVSPSIVRETPCDCNYWNYLGTRRMAGWKRSPPADISRFVAEVARLQTLTRARLNLASLNSGESSYLTREALYRGFLARREAPPVPPGTPGTSFHRPNEEVRIYY